MLYFVCGFKYEEIRKKTLDNGNRNEISYNTKQYTFDVYMYHLSKTKKKWRERDISHLREREKKQRNTVGDRPKNGSYV